jgi:hypothetical protein
VETHGTEGEDFPFDLEEVLADERAIERGDYVVADVFFGELRERIRTDGSL